MTHSGSYIILGFSSPNFTIAFSRDSLLKHKPRVNRLQLPSSSEILDMIPEEDEPRSSSSSMVSTPRSECKRTFSTSYIEVSLAESNDEQDVLQPYRPALQPLVVPPRSMPYERPGSTSPTPSTSSASSYAPLTPTSSDDELPLSKINPRPVSIRPLNITKSNGQTSTFNKISFIEPDSDDESDSEWYIQEFSKMIWPLPPSFPKQPPSRPESFLQLEPLSSEAPITRLPRSPKRVASRTHKRGRSIPKGALPPIPTIPAHSLPSPSVSPSIPEIVEPLGSPNTVIQPRPPSLSLRKPPPRTSIPTDCLPDDFIIGEDQSYWSSDFVCEQPSPALISPAPRRASSHLTFPLFPDSPGSMYSQSSGLPHPYRGDFDDFGEIEFAVDNVRFDFSNDAPMRLPLSLPNTPSDLEADFALGLEELRTQNELAPPTIAVLDVDGPDTSYDPSSSFPPTPSTSASFDSYYDSENDAEFYLAEQDDTLNRPVLRSKWSNSTLASVPEEQSLRSKLGAANKFRFYFGVGSTSSKSKQQQQGKQHQRTGSGGALTAAKAAVTRAASGATSPRQPSPTSSRSSAGSVAAPPASPRTKKKAQRQVVIVPPSSSYMSPRNSASPMSSPVSPHYGKGKKGRESGLMVIGYGYGGVGKGFGRRVSAASDAESEENGGSLKRKPIPVEMFLRSASDVH